MADQSQIAERMKSGWLYQSEYETLPVELAPRNMGQAYEAQQALQTLMLEHRGPIAGRKIALAAKTMQEMLGIDQPIAGGIFANDVHQSPASVSANNFIRMGLEFELALELANDIAPQAATHTPDSVLALIAGVRPAFELIEDRNADYTKVDVLTIIADNAWCGGVVLGPQIENWRDLDLDNIQSTVVQSGVDDEITNTGAAAPLTSLAWVLNHFSSRNITLKAGEHIITGSAARTRFPRSGDRFAYHVAGNVVELEVG
jgi:2-keto-4-pentenoate hydratase